LLCLERDYFALLMGVEAVNKRIITSDEHHALETLVTFVKQSAALSDHVPRLPMLLPKLLHSLRDRNKSGKALADLIHSDPAMVAEVLRTANSPYYRTSNKIRDIEHAIVVLGIGGLRETVARLALRPVMQFDFGSTNQTLAPRLWEQSNKCASASAWLAAKAGVDRFDAFLAGLIHNIGAAVAFRIMNRALGKIPPTASERFRRILDVVVPRITFRVAREWALPEAVVAGLNPRSQVTALGCVVVTAARLSKLHTLVESARYAPEVYSDAWICASSMSAHQIGCLEELDRVVHLLASPR